MLKLIQSIADISKDGGVVDFQIKSGIDIGLASHAVRITAMYAGKVYGCTIRATPIDPHQIENMEAVIARSLTAAHGEKMNAQNN